VKERVNACVREKKNEHQIMRKNGYVLKLLTPITQERLGVFSEINSWLSALFIENPGLVIARFLQVA